MNKVKFLYFGQNRLTSIGTANLNRYYGIIIASNYGAIIAHISPRPNHYSSDLYAGDRHAEAKMQEVTAVYNTNKKYFQTGGNSWVIYAVFDGGVALPDQQILIQDGLTRLGLGYSLATYTAGGPKDSFPGQGTIFVDRKGTTPVVYIEDRIVSEGSQGSTSTSYTTSSSYTGSSYNTSYTSPSSATPSTSYSATPSTSYSATPSTSYSATPSTSYAATPSYAGPSSSYSTGYTPSRYDQAAPAAPVVGEWTEWEWNEEYKCKVRGRNSPNVEGGYEWDYQVESSDKGKHIKHRRR